MSQTARIVMNSHIATSWVPKVLRVMVKPASRVVNVGLDGATCDSLWLGTISMKNGLLGGIRGCTAAEMA